MAVTEGHWGAPDPESRKEPQAATGQDKPDTRAQRELSVGTKKFLNTF